MGAMTDGRPDTCPGSAGMPGMIGTIPPGGSTSHCVGRRRWRRRGSPLRLRLRRLLRLRRSRSRLRLRLRRREERRSSSS
jgi:hypothetical protein